MTDNWPSRRTVGWDFTLQFNGSFISRSKLLTFYGFSLRTRQKCRSKPSRYIRTVKVLHCHKCPWSWLECPDHQSTPLSCTYLLQIRSSLLQSQVADHKLYSFWCRLRFMITYIIDNSCYLADTTWRCVLYLKCSYTSNINNNNNDRHHKLLV